MALSAPHMENEDKNYIHFMTALRIKENLICRILKILNHNSYIKTKLLVQHLDLILSQSSHIYTTVLPFAYLVVLAILIQVSAAPYSCPQ